MKLASVFIRRYQTVLITTLFRTLFCSLYELSVNDHLFYLDTIEEFYFEIA